MKPLLFILFYCFLASCSKTDANPETSDVIYQDLLQELEVSTKGLESESKNLEKLMLEKEKVVPQTGQIKFSQKKIFETQNTITKLSQQKQFFEIKLAIRKKEVMDRYLKSRKGGRPWPDKEEITTYRSTLKLQREKLSWDKTKGMKKEVPRGTNDSTLAKPTQGNH